MFQFCGNFLIMFKVAEGVYHDLGLSVQDSVSCLLDVGLGFWDCLQA